MIEKTILDYLTEYFTVNGVVTVPVVMQMPETVANPGNSKFILLEKTGSSWENRIFSATIAIQSYAPTLYEAAQLNEQVKAAMFNIITLDEITRIDLNSDYNFTDTETKQPRYQAVFDLTHY